MRITLFLIMAILMEISDTLAKKTAEYPEGFTTLLVCIFLLCLLQDAKELFS